MRASTPTLSAPNAAGASDAGLQRDVNEDRYHVESSVIASTGVNSSRCRGARIPQ